jgi:hypothetical protein
MTGIRVSHQQRLFLVNFSPILAKRQQNVKKNPQNVKEARNIRAIN